MIMVYLDKLINSLDERIAAANNEQTKNALIELKQKINDGEYGYFENGYDD